MPRHGNNTDDLIFFLLFFAFFLYRALEKAIEILSMSFYYKIVNKKNKRKLYNKKSNF